MRSFAVVAGLAAAALAAPHYEAAPPAVSSAAPAYPAMTPSMSPTPMAPGYPVETPVKSSSVMVPAKSVEQPGYPAKSMEKPGYPAETPVKSPVKTTEVVKATTYVCPEPTTITHGPSTYIISKSTTLKIPEYTATYVHTPEPKQPAKPKETPAVVAPPPAPHYPAQNGTKPMPPAGTATGVPTQTKPGNPVFTGAAGKATAGVLAIAGAVAAFL